MDHEPVNCTDISYFGCFCEKVSHFISFIRRFKFKCIVSGGGSRGFINFVNIVWYMISGRGFKIGMHTHLSKFYYYYMYISIPSDLESPIESNTGVWTVVRLWINLCMQNYFFIIQCHSQTIVKCTLYLLFSMPQIVCWWQIKCPNTTGIPKWTGG